MARTLAIADPKVSRLDRLVSLVTDLNAQIKELTGRKDALNIKLLALVKDSGDPDDEGKVRLENDTHKLVVVHGSNSRIDARILLANNVAPKIVKKATVVTEYEYVKITAKVEG